jgi:hypothetical protein
MSEELRAGSFKLTDFKLIKAGKEYDIKDFLVELSLFEDIFSNTLSGTAIITDSANLVGSLPIVGGEILNVTFSVPAFTNNGIQRSFYVFAVRDRSPSSTDRQQTYMLSFTTLEAAVDNVTYISRKYTGFPNDIAEEIFDEYLSMPVYWDASLPMPKGLSRDKSLAIPEWRQEIKSGRMSKLETTKSFFSSPKNKVTFLAPLWTPFKTLNWLANRNIEGDNEAPTTFCWETSQGHYFGSVDAIFKSMSDRSDRKIYFYGLSDEAIKTIMADNGTPQNMLPLSYSKVETIIIPKMSDVFKSQENGHYASNLHVFDVVTKKYDEYIFDFASNFDNYEHLHGTKGNPHPTFPTQQIRNIYSYRVFRPKHKMLFNDYEEPKYEDWVLQRTSLMYDLSNIKVEITVPGYCTTEVGEVVEFYYPKMGDKPDGAKVEDLIDPYLSGGYIVTAVRHIVTQDKYYMRMELTKESFATSMG